MLTNIYPYTKSFPDISLNLVEVQGAVEDCTMHGAHNYNCKSNLAINIQ